MNQIIAPAIQVQIRNGLSQSLPRGRLHFAAHSHHPWPDVTEVAQRQYWQDSTHLLDSKWNHIFSKIVPRGKQHLCDLLRLSSPEQIVEGTSSFELVTRLFSSFDLSQPLRILTTDSEFYSFARFMGRLEEQPNIHIDRVSTTPFESFEERFKSALDKESYDLVFSSLVFFNSGFYADRLIKMLSEYADPAVIIVDIYHAGGAVPLNLSAYENKIYFVGGGYKYLSAGEGACFLTVPTNCRLRPLMTGWLSEFGALETGLGENIGYTATAQRFAGATYDPSGWYRLNAVMDWWQKIGLNPSMIHDHVRALQTYFIEKSNRFIPVGFAKRLDWGNFLAIPTDDAQALTDKLRSQDIFVDARDGFLRIGFGYYQSPADVDKLITALRDQI
jgi:selenocysteine lyase/cysteine desulfurase